MYHYIEGKLAYTDSQMAVIDCAGVGYKLFITELCRHKIEGSEKARLYCYLSVKEDALDLFGFYDEDELAAFKMLIGVTKVGPKVAIAILSAVSPSEFVKAVSAGDSVLLTRAQGVGGKLAERIVMELRDKVAGAGLSPASPAAAVVGSARSEAVNALSVLGYSRIEATEAVGKTDPSISEVEDIIREALRFLSR